MAYTQAMQVQDLLLNEAKDCKGKPAQLAQVARAWKELEYLKRDIRMKPKPKPVDVAPTVKKSRSVPFHEPAEASPQATLPARSPKADQSTNQPAPKTTPEPPDEPTPAADA